MVGKKGRSPMILSNMCKLCNPNGIGENRIMGWHKPSKKEAQEIINENEEMKAYKIIEVGTCENCKEQYVMWGED